MKALANTLKTTLTSTTLTSTTTALDYAGLSIDNSFANLAADQHRFIFEYNANDEDSRPPRYSVIGYQSLLELSVSDGQISLEQNGEISDFTPQNIKSGENVIDVVDGIVQSVNCQTPAEFDCFHGGWFGYFGYDTIRYVFPHKLALPTHVKDELNIADIRLFVPRHLLVLDHKNQTAHWLAYTATDEALPDCPFISTDVKSDKRSAAAPVRHEYPQRDFESAVEKIKHYITEGEIMQAVLSQRMAGDYHGSALECFNQLVELSPAPYQYLVSFGDYDIVGCSPETLIQCYQDTLTSSPMAGTRRRGITEQEDIALELELLADEKECAEHLMLIDLARNDLGRVAKPGSVKVTRQMQVERYSNVMHITSTVKAQRQSISPVKVIAATLPAGTLVGAPKVRAVQILDEFESTKRGIYGGGLGYIDFNGNLNLAITIRTAVKKDQRIYFQSGAGIVNDSKPRLEWEETMHKNANLRKLVSANVPYSFSPNTTAPKTTANKEVA